MPQDDKDIYNVNTYSEKELFDILDLFHPTDRELEAKILSYIDKYSNSSNVEIVRLHDFFVDIYRRFFYLDDNEDNEDNEDYEDYEDNVKEGFVSMNPITNPITSNQNTSATENNVQLTTPLTYAKGKLNPILKQSYQRIITIDSQYRDSKSSISTQFTFNFTETLKDVLSLKLYAVQIPYTWYTISQSYGSNFIYIKGNSPGINNGLHDISINIPPGNYTLNTVNNVNTTDRNYSISSAIQQAIRDISGDYKDIDFGTTQLSYDTNKCKATFTIDIQKQYNEAYYYFYFPDTFYSPVPTTNINRSKNLSSFLGFNSSKYSTCSVYSSRSITNSLDNNIPKYAFDASNNKITIVQYYTDATSNYIPGVSTIYQTLDISFHINVDTNYLSTQQYIYDYVNSVIMNDSRFNRPGMIDSSVNLVPIQGKDICGNVLDNSGNSYFQWQFKLNRFNKFNIPQSKTVLIVPSVETTGTNPIWVGPNSCFYFDASYNEINNLISETFVYSSNFIISSGNYFLFKCNDPLYDVSGINDLSYSLATSIGYSLNGYLSEINNGFLKINRDNSGNNGFKNIFNVNNNNQLVTSPSPESVAYFSPEDSKFHMSVDMNKYFFTQNFRIDISNSIFTKLLGFKTTDISLGTPLSDNITFSATSSILGNYPGGSLLMVIYPDAKIIGQNGYSRRYGISNDVSINVYLPAGNYEGFNGLVAGMNSFFRTFSDVPLSNPLRNMNISMIPTGTNNQVTTTWTINIIKILTQNDYTISFHDTNFTDASYNQSSWYKNLKLYNQSYKLSLFNFGPFSDISGSDTINSDQIDLTRGGNRFQLVPIDEGVIGAGTLTFTIPYGTYNRIALFSAMNNLFDSNPVTAGTRISYITSVNGSEYTKIRWNVNKVYKSDDYKIVFYDLYSFVSCFLGNKSIRNATWDTTLGWIMGFHQLTEYTFSPSNLSSNGTYYDISSATFTDNLYSLNNSSVPYRTIVTLTGDTTVSVNLYNYFMVILDDYNSSHLNDGLVTITPKDNNLSLPYYANRAKYICDPVTKQVLNTGITDVASNNLTQNQIYSINQIINTQNTPKSYTSQGVYVSDIFGLVPIKTTGYSPGQVYVEFGGTLQAQDRTYFGPVNIHRMSVSLLNDRGEVVDLNGANWSLQFVCEQLYQNNNDIKK